MNEHSMKDSYDNGPQGLIKSESQSNAGGTRFSSHRDQIITPGPGRPISINN